MLALLALLGCSDGLDKPSTDSDTAAAVDQDGDGISDTEDCAPSDPAIPAAEEFRCDNLDDDCDGAVDEGLTSTWYLDADGDGYGGDSTFTGCLPPEQYYATSDDCDDNVAAIYPGAAEDCGNGTDDNCDDVTDGEDEASCCYVNYDVGNYEVPESPGVITLDGVEFPTLQSAVEAAGPGDTIMVSSGFYADMSADIEQELTVECDNAWFTSLGTTFYITADNVSVSGCNVVGSVSEVDNGGAFRIVGINQETIGNVQISNLVVMSNHTNGMGSVYVNDASVLFTNVECLGNTVAGSGDKGACLYITRQGSIPTEVTWTGGAIVGNGDTDSVRFLGPETVT